MSEVLLAERVAREILSGGKRRILVRNVKDPEKLNAGISANLDTYQVLTFSGSDTDPVRECLFSYFTGDCVPDAQSSFEAAWRSHLTEIALISSDGMECAAGLHSVKDSFREYLLEGSTADTKHLEKILVSFGKKLPVLFCFINFTPPADLITTCDHLPPFIAVFSGSSNFYEPDLVLNSDSIGESEILEILKAHDCLDSPCDVMRVTRGNAGLVLLYAGIHKVFGLSGRSVPEMLNAVFDLNPELRRFACAAALLSPGFIPSEAASISGTEGYPVFLQGREIHLWKGHLVASFLSETVREFVANSIGYTERGQILQKSSEVVISSRGISPVVLKYSGHLLASAGRTEEASEKFIAAGNTEEDQLTRAGYFRTAAALNPEVSARCLFQAALSLFRAEHTEEASGILEDASLAQHSDSSLLRRFCSEQCTECLSHDIHPVYPEISPAILKSRSLHQAGLYSPAEKLLTEMAAKDDPGRLPALVELGDQLFKRGLYDQSLCVMRAALIFLKDQYSSWMETRIRYTLARVFNRTGRFREFQVNIERLMELSLISRDLTRLVSLYNMFANSMLLKMDLEKALKIYQAAIRTAGREKSLKIKSILNNLSIAQRKLHRMDDSLKTLMRLVRVCVSTGDLARASVAYGNMARLFVDLSRFDSAGDCLETMIEFSDLSGKHSRESICYISAQIAFAQHRVEDALLLIDQAVNLSRSAGSRRRLSLNLVKKGSMLLRAGFHSEAAETLRESLEISSLSNSLLNYAVARMKLKAAECFTGENQPSSLLSAVFSEGFEDTHRGEGFYWHWRLTGSRQSLTAAAQLLSTGLLEGLHHHSYLYMLQEIAPEIPVTLAAALPLVHNYPSCNSMKGD